jgi:hypothetical protein
LNGSAGRIHYVTQSRGDGFTRCLAREVAKTINVNAIARLTLSENSEDVIKMRSARLGDRA